jgi:hypothetical protein
VIIADRKINVPSALKRALAESKQPQIQQRRRGQRKNIHSVTATKEWQLHYETQETLKKQEGHQQNEAVEERNKDPK